MGKHHHHHHDCPRDEREILDRLVRNCCKPCEKPGEHFTKAEAREIARVLGVNTECICYDLDQFWMGLNIELEHGLRNPATNITDNDPIETGKIVLAHLNVAPDYYTRLVEMRREAREYWRKVRRRAYE